MPLRWRRIAASIVALALAMPVTAADTSSVDARNRGRDLYLSGRHADGRALTAYAAGNTVALPADFAACVNCHGHEARGISEGGRDASDIRWLTLTKPYEVARADGRRRSPYDAAGLLVAITSGRDASGQPLDTAMPRFELTAQEVADLIAYLQYLDAPDAQGISDDTIRVGIIAGAADGPDGRLLAAWFDEINRSGGVFRRRLEPVFLGTDARPGDAQVLAVLDANDDADDSASAAFARAGVPVIEPTDDAGAAEDRRYRFSMLPGTVERARLLARHASAQSPASPPRLALLYPATAPSSARAAFERIAQAFAAVARPVSVANVEAIIAELRDAGVDHVVVAGGCEALDRLTAQALPLGWDPLFLWTQAPPIDRADTRALTLDASRLADVSEDAGIAYARIVDVASTGWRRRARDFALLASARLLTTALEQAGRDVGRERLVETLQGLRDFRSGFLRPGSLSARRHVAASGMYVVPLPASRHQPEPVWLTLE
jgi:mono/diheme cytochrome c family protein/ABC-type branched-subunit amino acid transport system substrate-binding protein